jgi:2-oxoglutarate dehydrogenase E2 component (EC 2.3.1.61)
MSIDVKVPVLPESVSDATVATWHKKPGDTVRRDENLVDLETDKVVLEVPAPADGVLESISAEEGDVVEANDVIAVLKEGEVKDEPEVEQQPEQKEQETSSEKPVEQKSADKQADSSSADVDTGSAGPAARKMMKDDASMHRKSKVPVVAAASPNRMYRKSPTRTWKNGYR